MDTSTPCQKSRRTGQQCARSCNGSGIGKAHSVGPDGANTMSRLKIVAELWKSGRSLSPSAAQCH